MCHRASSGRCRRPLPRRLQGVTLLRAGTSSCAWPSRNSPIVRVCATSRRVSARCNPSSITWAFALVSRGRRWPRPNETRNWRIYADFAQDLITTARALYVDEPLGVDLANTVYALDATIIELCLSVFPWARYRRHDAAVKLHTQVDLRGLIPTIVHITEGNMRRRDLSG